jgi:hypothetical protein
MFLLAFNIIAISASAFLPSAQEVEDHQLGQLAKLEKKKNKSKKGF